MGVIASAGELLGVESSGPPTSLAAELLEPKYQAPRLREGLVQRLELLSKLRRARAYPLVLLTAPAGYGKTTLLAQWCQNDERPCAWVTLDDGDQDPAVLASSIATALTPTGVGGAGFVLVIDDAHVGNPDVLRDAVLEVLTWLPQGSQVAVASRCEPRVPGIVRMRAHRLLFELGADELSMSNGEAAALLSNAGLELQFTDVEDLVSRTEGWPVVLELAALSVAGEHDPAQALARLAGDDHLISAYFRAELLNALSPASRRFLTRVSLLDRISGPLCDAVLRRGRSGALLARMASANIPLRPADPSHEWYRLHGLFREMLQTELRRSEPNLRAELHRRAADWHSEAGDLDRAIDHSRLAGDMDRSSALLWTHLSDYLGAGRNDIVRRWLRGVTAEQATGCAPFALVAAHSNLADGNIALAEQWARSATVALSRNSASRATVHHAGALVIKAWAAREGAAQMAHDGGHAYDLLPDDSPWRANCCFLRGTAALLMGDLASAELHFEEGAARGAVQSPDVASLCLAQLAVVALEHGDAGASGDLALRAAALIEDRDLNMQLSLALVSAVSTAVGVSQRDGYEAKVAAARCASVIGHLEHFAPWYGAETRILLARGLLALGDVPGARRQLADASRLSRRTPDFVIFRRWFDDAWDQFDKRAESALSGVRSLTTAELRVLRFLPTHFSFHEIAQRLHVSPNTVKTHVHTIYRKLEASSRSEAVANASKAGVLGA